MPSELLPCPFCGREQAKTEFGRGPHLDRSRHQQFMVICLSCCATAFSDNEQHAIGKWNTRAPSPPNGTAVETPQPQTCPRKYPCSSSDARTCAHDFDLGGGPKVCTCRCHRFLAPTTQSQLTEAERVRALESAIQKTLDENRHLADGDICTLIHLKRAMSAARPTTQVEAQPQTCAECRHKSPNGRSCAQRSSVLCDHECVFPARAAVAQLDAALTKDKK